MNYKTEYNHPPFIWWMIWGALMTGIFIIYFVAQNSGSSAPKETASTESAVWMVAFAPFVISTVIRWLILPRSRSVQTAIAMFIVGLAMAEMPCMLGFVFHEHRTALFVLSVLGMLQMAPFFASRYSATDN